MEHRPTPSPLPAQGTSLYCVAMESGEVEYGTYQQIKVSYNLLGNQAQR